MRKLLKIALICFPLFIAAPSQGQIHWGVDLRLGSPVPPPPYPYAVWEPGYYDYYDYHYVWVPGRWHRHGWVNPGRHYGWDRGRREHGHGRGHGGRGR